MKVNALVVDDELEKRQKVKACLADAGINPANIDLVESGVEAREKLLDHRYEIMVLDIALPMRKGDEPDRLGGIVLLEEVFALQRYNAPSTIIGLTQHSDLKERFAEKFSSRYWYLEEYDRMHTGWLERLKARTAYIVRAELASRQVVNRVDLAVVTALALPELEQVLRLDWSWGIPAALDQVTFVHEGRIHCGPSECSVVAAAAPRMGMVAAALLSAKIISQFHPKLLCMVGICAGVGASRIGDIVLGDPVWDWQSGKYDKGKFLIAPDQIDVPVEVTERFRMMSQNRDWVIKAHEAFNGTKPDYVPACRQGPVASGSSVVADAKRVLDVKQQNRKLTAIEMEIYGVYAAAKDCAPPRPRCFAIKSVCDHGDGQKNDDYQVYAAYMSAMSLDHFARQYLGELSAMGQ
jgi:nucleoside phosphorylase